MASQTLLYREEISISVVFAYNRCTIVILLFSVTLFRYIVGTNNIHRILEENVFKSTTYEYFLSNKNAAHHEVSKKVM